MDPMLEMHVAAAQGLADLKDILTRIDYQHYTSKISLLSEASVGQHVRHIVEFYQCVIASLDSGVVNYCQRKRDASLETSLKQVQLVICTLLEELRALPGNRSLHLATNLEGTVVVATNLDRELLYCMEHTVHHMATIKIGLKLLAPDLEIPIHVGTADSTLGHRNRNTLVED